MVIDVEGAAGPGAPDVARIDVRPVGEAEGDQLAAQRLERLHRVAVVEVGDDLARGRHLGGEGPEGLLHILQPGEIVQVVGVHVQYHGHRGVEGEEGVVILAALEDDGVPAAHAVPRVQQRQRAAYHNGRVPLCGHEYVSAHAGGGRLAVCPGYAERVVIVAHDGAPGLCPLENGHAACPRLHDLRVRVAHGGGAHDELDVGGHVHRRVAYLHVYPQLAQVPRLFALGHIRAVDDEAHAGEHLRQRRHGDAADADEVPALAGLQVFFKISHNFTWIQRFCALADFARAHYNSLAAFALAL